MKKLPMICCTTAICGILLLWFGWRWIQNEYAIGYRHTVYQDMSEIRLAALRYAGTNGTLPTHLELLTPTYLSKQLINRKAAYDIMHRKVIVPARPYSFRVLTNDFEILCVFYGKGY